MHADEIPVSEHEKLPLKLYREMNKPKKGLQKDIATNQSQKVQFIRFLEDVELFSKDSLTLSNKLIYIF